MTPCFFFHFRSISPGLRIRRMRDRRDDPPQIRAIIEEEELKQSRPVPRQMNSEIARGQSTILQQVSGNGAVGKRQNDAHTFL